MQPNNIILLSLAFTLVVISVSGAIAMMYGLTPNQKKYVVASRHFAMGFVCIGVFSFISLLFPVKGEWAEVIKLAASNTCTFIGIYFFRLGFAKRSGHPSINRPLFIAHLLTYAAISVAFSSDQLLGNHPAIRVAIVNLNFIVIIASIFPIVKLNRHKTASFGERIVYATLSVSIIMMFIYPIARSQTDSVIGYLLIVTPIKALQLHIWVTGLLVLLLSDVITIYRSQAITDGMTGLFNRTYFMQHVQQTLYESQSGSLIVCDIDHFKRVNDTYGHNAGDKALKKFSQLLMANTPSPSTIARFGGEEFALFLPNALSSEAERIANTLKEKTEHLTLQHEHHNFQFTASFGVCYIPNPRALETALQSADKALYTAKHSGRNTVSVYN